MKAQPAPHSCLSINLSCPTSAVGIVPLLAPKAGALSPRPWRSRALPPSPSHDPLPTPDSGGTPAAECRQDTKAH